MNEPTVEKRLTGEYEDLTEIVKEAETLKPQQQEKLGLFIRGYVTAMSIVNEKDKAASQ